MGSLVFVAGAAAQGVWAPPTPEFAGPASVLPGSQTNRVDASSSLGSAATPAPKGLLELGQVKLHAQLLYRFLYGDGIPVSPNQNATTAINEVYTGLRFELGRHWTLDYTPSLHVYSNRQFHDVVDQSVALKGATTYQDWTFGLSQGYDFSDQPLIETGAQTSQEIYATALSGTCQLNQKLSLELGLSQSFRFMGEGATGSDSFWHPLGGNSGGALLQDSRDWASMNWLNYQFWPRFGLAIGVGAGYTELGTGSTIASEQLQGRFNWRVGDKLSLVVSLGADNRQFLNGSQPALLNPVFAASVVYQPFEVTTLSLKAGRTVSPAYFQNEMTEDSELSGILHQRLLKKLFLDVSCGYRISTFATTTSAQSTSREDHFTFLSLRLSAPFLRRGTASLLYQASSNSSSQAGYTYSSTQVGLEIGYHF